MNITSSSSMNQGSGLVIDNVSVGYDGQTVVHNVNLEFRPNTVTALVGPNGSGKSTLLRAVAKLHPIASGSSRFDDGQEISSLPSRELARRLTMLTQMRPTPQGVRVRDAVALGRHPYRGRWRNADSEGTAIIERAMKLTGVDAIADDSIDALSGGQIQRVWLASCLAQDTEVLLLDEPTNHLDMKYQVELLELLYSLAHGHGVCVGVVLHDLNHAAAVADEIALLSEGRIVATGTPREVLRGDLLTEVYGIDVTCTYSSDQDLVTVASRSPRLRAESADRTSLDDTSGAAHVATANADTTLVH